MPLETMTATAAATRAWETYLMLNPSARGDDERRAVLASFMEKRLNSAEFTVESLAVEGIKFLKRLDAGGV